MATRTCGTCTLCCKLIGVPETGKPAGTWCPDCRHEGRRKGCGIHPTRPQSCRNFSCFWLMEEELPAAFRPDRIGVVAALNGAHGGAVLHLDPERPDALAEGAGAALLGAVASAFDPVYVVCGADRMMIRRAEDGEAARGS